MTRKAKSDYYLKNVSENRNNPSKFWKQIKSLSGSNYFLGLSQHIFVNSIEIKNKSDIIGFNYHFVSAAFILNESKLSCH